MELKEMLQSLVSSILSRKPVLAVVVSLILVLSNTMETVGQMKRLYAFSGLISRPILNLAMFRPHRLAAYAGRGGIFRPDGERARDSHANDR